MSLKYSVSDLAKLRGTSERATYNLLKRFRTQLKPFRVKEGTKVFYLTEALSILGINDNGEALPEEVKPNQEQEQLKKQLQELKQANEMLTFQISANYETINELRKDKEQLYKTISQLTETIKGSLMNTQRAQTLQYLDKDKNKES